ncbi:hypothetical protein D3C86_1750620 [compost metagenome]
MRLGQVLRRECETAAIQCRLQDLVGAVEGELSPHLYAFGLPRAHQWPREETAARGEPQCDAAVLQEILRRLRFRMVFEVGG